MTLRARALTGTFFAVALVLTAFSALAKAAEIRTGDQPSIGAEERIAEDTYLAGGNISAAGVVTGDLTVAGGNIVVKSSVGGDLSAGAGSLTILGNVADDLRVAGGTVVLQGNVGSDAMLAGGQLDIGGNGIKGDLVAGGGTVRVDAPVGGNIRIGGGDVHINSKVAGNVEVFAETLTLGSGARIEGTLTYTAAKEAKLEEGAVVSGETTFNKRDRTISVGGLVAVISFALLTTIVSQLLAALLLGLFFRKFVLALVESVVEQPLLEVGRGLIIIIVLPILSMILIASIIGIPIGALGLGIFATLMLYLWMMTPVLLGSLAYKAFFKGDYRIDWRRILLGVLIYTILGLIPIVGWLAQLFLMLLTLGVTAKLKWQIAKEWR